MVEVRGHADVRPRAGSSADRCTPPSPR
jgi:hypothetical protein